MVNSSRQIFRFSSKKALFILGPQNAIRRFAIFILTHSYPFLLINFFAENFKTTDFFIFTELLRVLSRTKKFGLIHFGEQKILELSCFNFNFMVP